MSVFQLITRARGNRMGAFQLITRARGDRMSAFQLITRAKNGESGYADDWRDDLVEIVPRFPLSASQTIALKLCASNPLTVIQGAAGSGKTRLGLVFAEAMIQQNRSLLILARSPATLDSYRHLSIAPYSPERGNYRDWCCQQIRQRYLRQSMDFLPADLLPDTFLQSLRAPRDLESYLSLGENDRLSRLQSRFPTLSASRLAFLNFRLTELSSLFRQQLWLYQKAEALSDGAIETLAGEIPPSALATLSDLDRLQNEFPGVIFDTVIIEESESCSWEELTAIANFSKRLIILGDLELSIGHREERPFYRLTRHLLPNYRYELREQFRLHFSIARPVFEYLHARWFSVQPRGEIVSLPGGASRLQWRDIRGGGVEWEGRQILAILTEFSGINPEDLGILTLQSATRDWLRENLSPAFDRVFVGNCQEWRGTEKRVAIVNYGENRRSLSWEEISIPLTRATDYLILSGNYRNWAISPLRNLLERPELQRQREVSFS